MLDFNPRLKPGDVSEAINDVLDRASRLKVRERRPYLGASAIGDACARRLQYDFMGIAPDRERFEPRTYRIFERGHALERVAANELKAAGFDLVTQTKDGGQVGFEAASGRFRGHVDGIIFTAPLPMRLPCLWEHKALGSKGWKSVAKDGVAVAYPHYAAQIAVYCAYLDAQVPGLALNPALFTATNADTMERYHELVPFDGSLAQTASDRAVTILRAAEAGDILPRGFASSDHFECRFCAWAATCWGT